jgi:hypothetical protein
VSPKRKGYKNRLPTVLPPAPRAAPEQDATWPARGAPATPPTPSPRVVEPIRTTPPIEPVEPQPAPQPAPERRSPALRVIVALALAGLAIGAIVGVVVVPRLLDDGPDRPAAADDAGAPAGLVADTSYVVSRVLPNGDVVVRQRIRTAEPIWLLRLTLPRVPGAGDMSARQVDLVADGDAVAGQATITDGTASYGFPPATEMLLSYRLTGAVRLSDSAPGRGLAMITTLDVQYSPRVERETRVVRAAEVLSLACSRSVEEAPVPCGEPDGDGRWQVELTGGRVVDRVMAQLNVG